MESGSPEGLPDIYERGGGGAESLGEIVLIGRKLPLHVEDVLEIGQASAVLGIDEFDGFFRGGYGIAKVVDGGVGGAVGRKRGFAFGGGIEDGFAITGLGSPRFCFSGADLVAEAPSGKDRPFDRRPKRIVLSVLREQSFGFGGGKREGAINRKFGEELGFGGADAGDGSVQVFRSGGNIGTVAKQVGRERGGERRVVRQGDWGDCAQALLRVREPADEDSDGVDGGIDLRLKGRYACLGGRKVHLGLTEVEFPAEPRLVASANEIEGACLKVGIFAGIVKPGLERTEGEVRGGELGGEDKTRGANILDRGGKIGGGRLDIAPNASPEIKLPLEVGARSVYPGRIVGILGGSANLASLPIVGHGAGKIQGRGVVGAGNAELRRGGIESRNRGGERRALGEKLVL